MSVDQLAAFQTLLATIVAAIGAYYTREQFVLARKQHQKGTTTGRAWIKELVGVSVTVVGVGVAVAGFYAYQRIPGGPAVPHPKLPDAVKDRNEGPPVSFKDSSPPDPNGRTGEPRQIETEVTVRPPVFESEDQTYTLRAEVAAKGSGEIIGAVWFFRDGERLRPNAILKGKTAELAGVALGSDQKITAEFVPSQDAPSLRRSMSKEFVFIK